MNRVATFDLVGLKAGIDLAEVVGRYVKLRRVGPEYSGLCPFHSERSPSFTVIPKKGFVHCFGCGVHLDVIGFLQLITGCSFVEACKQLGGQEFAAAREGVRRESPVVLEGTWVPLMPVPETAPDLLTDRGWTVPVFNPKQGRMSRMKPTRVDAYRNADGRLLGYVLRCDFPDQSTGKIKKWTPAVTWCIGPHGAVQWCLQHFPAPRPLQGLDDLAAKPGAPVLICEGEKCRAAGAAAWGQYAVMTWPGGSHGVPKADWSPLANRDCVLWPDADLAGRKAMVGWSNDAGMYTPGIAQLLSRVGARSIRLIDTEGRPKGWDIADALEIDGWTPTQLAAWAAERVVEVSVLRG